MNHKWLASLLLALVSLAYAGVLSSSFLVFDDTPYIVNNPAIHEWKSVPSFFRTDFWRTEDPRFANYYRPLQQCWLLLNYKAFGLRGCLWHLSSLALYLVNVWLFWKLACKFISIPRTDCAPPGRDDPYYAILAAALFALHRSEEHTSEL